MILNTIMDNIVQGLVLPSGGECPFLADIVDKVGYWRVFKCPLLLGADILFGVGVMPGRCCGIGLISSALTHRIRRFAVLAAEWR